MPTCAWRFQPPDPAELVQEALVGLTEEFDLCTCPTHYHALWGALKAAGIHRGLYTEAPVLAQVLTPLLRSAPEVLIAGTADATSLQLLSHLCATRSVRFTVADQCPAPLRMVERQAGLRRLKVRTVLGSLAEIPAPVEPWDIVFLHYTLSFMDGATRRQVLGALSKGLARQGQIVCAVKFDAQSAPQGNWPQAMTERLESAFAAHPRALATLREHLPRYAAERSRRSHEQATLPVIRSDFESVGLVVQAVHETGRADWAKSAANPTPDRQPSLLLTAGHAG